MQAVFQKRVSFTYYVISNPIRDTTQYNHIAQEYILCIHMHGDGHAWFMVHDRVWQQSA